MNFKTLLEPSIQEFIREKTGTDVSKLALLKNPFPEIEYKILLNQIEARSKSKSKLPSWFHSEAIIYPTKLSIEQTSSETTAAYKSQLVSGSSLIDLTGGFGVDDYYFSKSVDHIVHCEINEELSEIVQHNFNQLKCNTIHCISGDSHSILKDLNKQFDWMYIDPSRRNDAKGKVFMLKDCLPNVPGLLDDYFRYSEKIMVKTAPILDISAGLSELKNVTEIHIIAVQNEVKELLWIIEKNKTQPVEIKTINIQKTATDRFDFSLDSDAEPSYSLPKKYAYEPNSAIMKSGGFDAVCNPFAVSKLHKNSHLYTSDELLSFPGRVFEIRQILDYSKKPIKEFLENTQANITVRNFPESVENIRKKWKIKPGGNIYCFFTTDLNNDKIVLLCTKINE